MSAQAEDPLDWALGIAAMFFEQKSTPGVEWCEDGCHMILDEEGLAPMLAAAYAAGMKAAKRQLN